MAKYDFYAERKVTGLGRWVNTRFRRNFWNLVQTRLTQPVSVCEFGPGKGELAELITGFGHQYVCYEEAAANVAILRQKFTVRAKRVPPFDESDSSIDVVAASHVLEHMKGPDEILAVVTDITRILRPGGYFLAAVPNIFDCGPLFYDSDWTHAYPTTPRRLDEVFRDAGLVKAGSCHIYFGFRGDIGRLFRLPFRLALKALFPILPDSIRYAEKFTKASLMLVDNYCALYQKP
jgi:SAM-dependent methyltransferase